jgi:hypothetical protein
MLIVVRCYFSISGLRFTDNKLCCIVSSKVRKTKRFYSTKRKFLVDSTTKALVPLSNVYTGHRCTDVTLWQENTKFPLLVLRKKRRSRKRKKKKPVMWKYHWWLAWCGALFVGSLFGWWASFPGRVFGAFISGFIAVLFSLDPSFSMEVGTELGILFFISGAVLLTGLPTRKFLIRYFQKKYYR